STGSRFTPKDLFGPPNYKSRVNHWPTLSLSKGEMTSCSSVADLISFRWLKRGRRMDVIILRSSSVSLPLPVAALLFFWFIVYFREALRHELEPPPILLSERKPLSISPKSGLESSSRSLAPRL